MQDHRIIALKRLIENAETLMLKHAPRRLRKPFKVGQLVSEIIPHHKSMQDDSGRPFFIPVQGKFKILDIFNGHFAQIQNLRNHKISVARFDTLVPYNAAEENRKIEYSKENLKMLPWEIPGDQITLAEHQFVDECVGPDEAIPSEAFSSEELTHQHSFCDSADVDLVEIDVECQTPIRENEPNAFELSQMDSQATEIYIPSPISQDLQLNQRYSSQTDSQATQRYSQPSQDNFNQAQSLISPSQVLKELRSHPVEERRALRPRVRHDYRKLAGTRPYKYKSHYLQLDYFLLTTDPYNYTWQKNKDYVTRRTAYDLVKARIYLENKSFLHNRSHDFKIKTD